MSHLAWLEQAQSDLKAAELLSAAQYHSQAIWLAGAAVEKAHKAILAALGLRYEDKHFKFLGHNTSEIAKLLPEALHDPIDPRIASMVAKLEARAGNSRYPAPSRTGTGPTPLLAPAALITDSQQEVADAQRLVEWCRDRVVRALSAARAMKP